MLDDNKVALSNKHNNPFGDLAASMKAAEEFAQFVVDSDTFGEAFKKPVLDEKGVAVPGEFTKNKADVIIAMHLGAELGLPPTVSITLGKRLNGKSYLAIQKGKTLGLDIASSLQNISVITNKNGAETYHTGVHVITNALIQGGCQYTILEDYKEIRSFTNLDKEPVSNNKVLDEDNDLKEEYFVFLHYKRGATSKEALATAKTAGKKMLIENAPNYRTTIHFVRESKNIDITISYSTQEAIDAGLLNGYHSWKVDDNGKPLWIDGKNNWNDNPPRMLRNRVFSIGGNIVVSDILGGTFDIGDIPLDAKVTQEPIDITSIQPVNTDEV